MKHCVSPRRVRACTVTGRSTKRDGPFTEAKEVIGGYGVFSAKSLEDATALATRFLALHGDEGSVECEIRQIEEPDARG